MKNLQKWFLIKMKKNLESIMMRKKKKLQKNLYSLNQMIVEVQEVKNLSLIVRMIVRILRPKQVRPVNQVRRVKK